MTKIAKARPVRPFSPTSSSDEDEAPQQTPPVPPPSPPPTESIPIAFVPPPSPPPTESIPVDRLSQTLRFGCMMCEVLFLFLVVMHAAMPSKGVMQATVPHFDPLGEFLKLEDVQFNVSWNHFGRRRVRWHSEDVPGTADWEIVYFAAILLSALPFYAAWSFDDIFEWETIVRTLFGIRMFVAYCMYAVLVSSVHEFHSPNANWLDAFPKAQRMTMYNRGVYFEFSSYWSPSALNTTTVTAIAPHVIFRIFEAFTFHVWIIWSVISTVMFLGVGINRDKTNDKPKEKED
jgi:hypothetical protein